jgi:hypothetical protein
MNETLMIALRIGRRPINVPFFKIKSVSEG